LHPILNHLTTEREKSSGFRPKGSERTHSTAKTRRKNEECEGFGEKPNERTPEKKNARVRGRRGLGFEGKWPIRWGKGNQWIFTENNIRAGAPQGGIGKKRTNELSGWWEKRGSVSVGKKRL